MKTLLYKVSPPRPKKIFYPSTFWHTFDWESSTTSYREGYIKDEVLYAGDFEEVNIHLFPRVRTVRVRCADADGSQLCGLGLPCTPGRSAYIFIQHSRREEVEAFRPTVFTFREDGFVRIRKGEYISREPQQAIAVETISIAEAIKRWNIEACYVDDLDGLISRLRQEGIYFDEQT